jgi:ubiquinone/menaquinone biosynthesis C-methylase UbiE
VADRARSVAFDRIADDYDRTRGGEDRGRAVAAALADRLPAGDSVLELGVGTGVVARALVDLGRDVIGVDLSVPMLRKARVRIGPRVANGDALRLPLRSRSVASIYAVWVLHLVADVRTALVEIVRVLKPGGVFLLVSSQPVDYPTDVHKLTRELVDRIRPPQDRPDRVASLAEQVGLRLVSREFCTTDLHQIAPTEQADQIEQRMPSALWDVDAVTWQAEVVPVIAAIRSLPEPDRPRQIQNTYPLLTFRRG